MHTTLAKYRILIQLMMIQPKALWSPTLAACRLLRSFCGSVHTDDFKLGYDSKRRMSVTWNDDKGKSISYFIDYMGNRFLEDPHASRASTLCVAMGKRPKGRNGDKMTWVYDLTGGIGRDSVRLLNSGYRVVIHERNPILVALLADALARLYTSRPECKNQIKLCPVDSTFYYYPYATNSDLNAHGIDKSIHADATIDVTASESCPLPAVVYLDPMYDDDTAVGRKAKVKKDTQLLHALTNARLEATSGTGDSVDEQSNRSCNAMNNARLFETARRLCRQRVVVKRSNKDAPLIGAIPHESVVGKTHRYDVYFKHRAIKYT